MLKLVLASLVMVNLSGAMAGEIKGVKFDDQMQVGETNLKLNGMGIRVVRRFGIPVKVYAGALYAAKSAQSFDDLWAQSEPKVIINEYMHSVVEKDKLEGGFSDGFKALCDRDKAECERLLGGPAKKFLSDLSDIRKGQRMVFEIHKDHVKYTLEGKKPTSSKIDDAEFARLMLAIYTSPKSLAGELRDGLLGIKKD